MILLRKINLFSRLLSSQIKSIEVALNRISTKRPFIMIKGFKEENLYNNHQISHPIRKPENLFIQTKIIQRENHKGILNNNLTEGFRIE